MSKLKERYKKEIVPLLMERLGYKNVMQAPRLEKVVLNIGLGEAITNAKALEAGEADLAAISGQHPVITRSKRSIAAFRLRAGMAIGVMVTLRGQRMWDFFEKLVKIVFPRTKDFRGISQKSLDDCGSITVGIADHTVFPEIDANKVDKIKSLGVVVGTNAKDKDTGYKLLKALGFPFKD
jgi:large subunit ribosomal protein L5